MAANEMAVLSWRTPFSTPIRKDDTTCRDIFQNSEKLLASAVSICRLKGSVECQTGGLITVCEELQNLIRLAFSEISRLEKDLKTQRSQCEDEVCFLKERVKRLEETNIHKQMYMENGEIKNVSRTVNGVDNNSQLGDLQEVVKVGNAHPIELLEDENCDNSDPCLVSLDITPSQKIPLVPVAQDQTPRSPLKTKRSDTKNSWKKLSSKKVVKPPDSPENTKDSTYDQDHNFGVLSFDELRSELPFYSDGEFSQDVPTTKGHYKDGKEELQNKAKRKDVGGKKPTTNSPQGSFTDDALQRKEKGKKDGRRKLIAEKSDNKGKTMYCDEVKEKNKGKKNGNSTVYKKLGRGSWQKPLRAKKSESDLSDQNTLEDPENEERKKSVEALVSSQNGQPKDTVTLSETEVSKQNSAAKQNDNQPLGDLSFLINVNSQISTFVSDPSQQECVLDPMTAKERHEVYKLTHLYKLRARIGSKTENSLTTVHLSKQYDTQMPKPGRVDFLLSELSVNASKEAEKESFKGKMKRRSSTSAKENEDGTTQDDLEQDAPPKKKLSRLSRGKKV